MADPQQLEFAQSVQIAVFNLCTVLLEQGRVHHSTYRWRALALFVAAVLGGLWALSTSGLPTALACCGAIYCLALAAHCYRQSRLGLRMQKAALARAEAQPPFCLPLF